MSQRGRSAAVVVFGLACAARAFGAQPEETAIRAGQTLAVTACIACHVVSRDSAVKPVLGPGIPSFENIANRPDSTVESLQASMKTAKWHDPAMTATLRQMSRLSDAQRSQVAAYIMSLRAKP